MPRLHAGNGAGERLVRLHGLLEWTANKVLTGHHLRHLTSRLRSSPWRHRPRSLSERRLDLRRLKHGPSLTVLRLRETAIGLLVLHMGHLLLKIASEGGSADRRRGNRVLPGGAPMLYDGGRVIARSVAEGINPAVDTRLSESRRLSGEDVVRSKGSLLAAHQRRGGAEGQVVHRVRNVVIRRLLVVRLVLRS